VLEELTPIVNVRNEPAHAKKGQARLSEAAARELLAKLEPFLKENDAECVSFIEDLGGVEGSETLAAFIENFDFQSAHEELLRIQRISGI